MRLLAAMSGGVDSAVAAARARDAGHEVVGVHLALSRKPASSREGARGCCTLDDANDARRAADVLDIPFYVWDLAERFNDDVIEDFVDSYARGETPNPCLRCNERIKFAAVLERALALDFDAVVTGHHARLTQTADGPVLRRSVDHAKDQSYVLGTLRSVQLSSAMFPLGESTKAQVRAEASERGLGVADKPDSTDICFIPSGDTAGWLRGKLGSSPGPVVDAVSGAVVGGHDGAYAYTVGQRKGLALSVPAADGKPRYVLGVDPVSSTVTVGPADRLDIGWLKAGASTYSGPPVRCFAQVRAHGAAVAATARSEGGELHVEFDEPLRAVARGQAVVLYAAEPQGDRVLGGGWISATGTS
jgi:tRNA-specific 2-thiouridylase